MRRVGKEALTEIGGRIMKQDFSRSKEPKPPGTRGKDAAEKK